MINWLIVYANGNQWDRNLDHRTITVYCATEQEARDMAEVASNHIPGSMWFIQDVVPLQ